MTEDNTSVADGDEGNRAEQLLKELVFWARFTVREEAKEWFEQVLDSPSKMRVYEALDGKRSFAEVGHTTGVPKTTIRDWVAKWEQLGIVQRVGEGRDSRVRRTVPLGSVGVVLSRMPNERRRET